MREVAAVSKDLEKMFCNFLKNKFYEIALEDKNLEFEKSIFRED